MKLTRKEVTDSLFKKRLIKGPITSVEVKNLEANIFRDVLELYLWICGKRKCRWIDEDGNSRPFSSFWSSTGHIIRDVAMWPWLVTRHLQWVTRLEQGASDPSIRDGNDILFLRTDHWFNIVSGGSVGHLAGVIAGFRNIGMTTKVVSTDYLVGVPRDNDFKICAPIYDVGCNLPEVPPLQYNEQLYRFLQSSLGHWQPRYVYQRYSMGNYTGVWLKRRYGMRYICEYNGSFPWMARNWERRPLFHEKLITSIEMLNLKVADLVVVVSETSRQELVQRGIDDSRILVNPNGVDTKLYGPHIDGNEIRRFYNIEDKLVVGFIGTFGPWHGADVLVQAFGILLSRRKDFCNKARLILIGDGATMPEIKMLVEILGISTETILTGIVPQSKGPQYLAACDVLAAPTLPNPDGTPFFGSPTKLFEYMATGKAIIASNIDQVGDIVCHDQTAWLTKPGNKNALADGLEVLLDDADRRCRLGDAARKEAQDHYTWDAHTSRTLARMVALP